MKHDHPGQNYMNEDEHTFIYHCIASNASHALIPMQFVITDLLTHYVFADICGALFYSLLESHDGCKEAHW